MRGRRSGKPDVYSPPYSPARIGDLRPSDCLETLFRITITSARLTRANGSTRHGIFWQLVLMQDSIREDLIIHFVI